MADEDEDMRLEIVQVPSLFGPVLAQLAAAQEKLDRELDELLTPEGRRRLRDAEARVENEILFGVESD